jgi:hypothetical protein
VSASQCRCTSKSVEWYEGMRESLINVENISVFHCHVVSMPWPFSGLFGVGIKLGEVKGKRRRCCSSFGWLERVFNLFSCFHYIIAAMSKKIGNGRGEAVRGDALAIPALIALRGEPYLHNDIFLSDELIGFCRKASGVSKQ